MLTLRARGGGGTVEIVFDGTDALRLRGTGCSLELEFETAPGASMYPARNGAWEVNARATLRKVLLRAETGGLEALTDWQGENSSRMTARFTPGPDGTWTAALDYFESTWTPRTPRPFAACEAEVRADFADFLGRLPSCAPEFEAARIRAAYVNWSALVRPCGHFRRPAMLMSKNHMSNVWSWDHAFNAMALMTGDPELAWDRCVSWPTAKTHTARFPTPRTTFTNTSTSANRPSTAGPSRGCAPRGRTSSPRTASAKRLPG